MSSGGAGSAAGAGAPAWVVPGCYLWLCYWDALLRRWSRG